MKLPSLSGLKITAIASIIAFGAGVGLGWHEKALRVPKLLEAQKKADAAECKVQQDKTKGENDALVKAHDRITRDAARFKRMHQPGTCIHPAGGGELSPSANEHAGVYAVSVEWLHDYASVCEGLRSELAVATGRSDE